MPDDTGIELSEGLHLRLSQLNYHYHRVNRTGAAASCIVCMAAIAFVEALEQFIPTLVGKTITWNSSTRETSNETHTT